MAPSRLVQIYDTTLRDGAQREGLSLSLEDKLRIARELDQLGVPFIEGGWPGANPKDVQFFWQVREHPLEQAEMVAFCFTRRPHRLAVEDPMIQALLAAGTRWVTIVGKSWDLHVQEGLKTSLAENLAMIRDTITYLCAQERRVLYDAEHWFDGYRHNQDYALATLAAAREAGAEWLVLCDTNGGTLPAEISQVVTQVRQYFGEANLGIHAHNDSGTAVANSLAAVLAGAQMVQGTVNGYGERCGNTNLCSVVPNLQLKLDYQCLPPDRMSHLTQVSHRVSEIVNLAPDEHAPFVGSSAFAHKGGLHVSAVERNPLTYEHITPEAVGNLRRIVISDQAGLSNILAKTRAMGLDLTRQDPRAHLILEHLKDLEQEGYQFEAAAASFELLVWEVMGQRPHRFQVQDFQVHSGSSSGSLATVKVTVNGEQILTAAEGNGPVSALDCALRKALVNFYPVLAQVCLTDYKVRILDGHSGTQAKTRVLVESSDGTRRWMTVGVSGNILQASYQAVVEGLEYGLGLHHLPGVPNR